MGSGSANFDVPGSTLVHRLRPKAQGKYKRGYLNLAICKKNTFSILIFNSAVMKTIHSKIHSKNHLFYTVSNIENGSRLLDHTVEIELLVIMWKQFYFRPLEVWFQIHFFWKVGSDQPHPGSSNLSLRIRFYWEAGPDPGNLNLDHQICQPFTPPVEDRIRNSIVQVQFFFCFPDPIFLEEDPDPVNLNSDHQICHTCLPLVEAWIRIWRVGSAKLHRSVFPPLAGDGIMV